MSLFLQMHCFNMWSCLDLHINNHSGLYKVETDHAEPNQGLHCPIIVSVGKRENKYPVELYAIYKMALCHLTHRQSSYVAGNNKQYLCLHVNYSELLSDLNQIWIFLTNFNENLQYQISLKISLQGVKLIEADSQMDEQTKMTKLTSAFCEYATHLEGAVYSMP